MNPKALDQIEHHFGGRRLDEGAFEKLYGQHALAFLKEMRSIFHLLRRVTFDLELPADTRHFSAAALTYLIEHQDFLPEAERDVAGLIDDVWVGYASLLQLSRLSSDEVLASHWRGETPLEEVMGLAENLGTLRAQVPTKVLEKIERFLGLDDR